jgi:hypothetical protein
MTVYGVGSPPKYIILGTAKNAKTQADFKGAQHFVAKGVRLPIYEIDGIDCQVTSHEMSQWFVATDSAAQLVPADSARKVWDRMSVWVEAHSRLIVAE